MLYKVVVMVVVGWETNITCCLVLIICLGFRRLGNGLIMR